MRQTNEPPDEPSEVLLVAPGSLAVASSVSREPDSAAARSPTRTRDGIYDLGDGIVVNLHEPFTDTNGNRIFEPLLGETYQDVGLDGVAASGDRGEGNATFDRDPDIDRWFAEDPQHAAREPQRRRDPAPAHLHGRRRRGRARLRAPLREPRERADGEGNRRADHNGFSRQLRADPRRRRSVHAGRLRRRARRFRGRGLDRDDLRNGDICGPAAIWQRLIHLLVAIDAAFPNPDHGLGGARPIGDTLTVDIASPALAVGGGAAPMRRVVVYRPPALHNTDRRFPILYFLGGHGQKPDDYERVGLLLDLLIAADALQNMYVAFLPGEGGTEGSFYVNHAVSEAQVPGLAGVTSGRYEDSIVHDLMPAIEITVLERRVR